MERRRFIVKTSGVLAAASAATVASGPHVIAQPKVQWRMPTTWPPVLDTLQGRAERVAAMVDEMSGGRFRIEVFPAGRIMPPFECFEAASKGTIEAFMATSAYWYEKEPAIEWFTSVPFGMNNEGMSAWFYQGDGLRLWEETYAPFDLVPRPSPVLAPQMAGWFRRKIDTIGDFKGIRMRIGTGFGIKVIARAGGTAVLTPAAEIYAALERGVIDAAEWVAPHDDMKLGLHQTARYYYYPGWHELSNVNEFTFNRKAYEALPVDLRRMLDHAVAAVTVYGRTEYNTKNAMALERLRTEFMGKVEILPFPPPVLRELKKLAADVVRQESAKTPMARKVHASYSKFQAQLAGWARISEGAYHQLVAL
jgi:TRAP-type mannitol/chloroaromatic compound transport system substrate-binding protein